METIDTIAEIREALACEKSFGRRVGFVPTMGFFHKGHLSLMRKARAENEVVVVSIFVNPLQFGPDEDFERYPRDLKRDSKLASGEGVDYLFAPPPQEMYPSPSLTTVSVKDLTEPLCGRFRPDHFDGVTTVVAKLLNIVQPDIAYFGTKDYQQLKVVERMIRDLDFPVAVSSVETVREPDGLAMSSRNSLLSPSERAAAASLFKALSSAIEAIEAGELDPGSVRSKALGVISAEPSVALDYLEILDAENLKEVDSIVSPVVVAVAARVGKVRLIDNIVVRRPFALST
ncbi:MAG: pantoate--beta-alanine ligase [Candidatus Aquicultorales bacterium]